MYKKNRRRRECHFKIVDHFSPWLIKEKCIAVMSGSGDTRQQVVRAGLWSKMLGKYTKRNFKQGILYCVQGTWELE